MQIISLIFEIIGIITFLIVDIYIISKLKKVKYDFKTFTKMIKFKRLMSWLFLNRVVEIILIGLISILIFLLPWFFTKHCISKGFLDFNTTGQIGDTFNGIIGPFIAWLAAILIYITLRQQIKANVLLKEQNDFRFILDNTNLLSDNKSDIKTLCKLTLEDFEKNIYHESKHLRRLSLILIDFKATITMVSNIKTNRSFLENKIMLTWESIYKPEIEAVNKQIVNTSAFRSITFILGIPFTFNQDYLYIEKEINKYK